MIPSEPSRRYQGSAVLKRCKTSPVLFLLWIVIICGAFILHYGEALKADYSAVQRILAVAGALVFVLIVHELIHALFVKLLSKAEVTIRLARDPMGFPALVTVWQGSIGKWPKTAVYLSPLALLTLIPLMILSATGSHAIFWVFTAMLNCIGAYYDLIDAVNTAFFS